MMTAMMVQMVLAAACCLLLVQVQSTALQLDFRLAWEPLCPLNGDEHHPLDREIAIPCVPWVLFLDIAFPIVLNHRCYPVRNLSSFQPWKIDEKLGVEYLLGRSSQVFPQYRGRIYMDPGCCRPRHKFELR
jgi:hypothetical protein